ncbi:uncharacterized protein LOC115323642 [Ixodes scapularis]|uniref:uncharacterized protein LOC115323642 n=1 Tax=Ixodes scapularis TaxID=6945 RepID=UPI001C39237B|nr:uncharacterized protein LOC115323642 [Ixodes scapularis]
MQHETMQLRLDVQQLSDQIAALEVPTGQAAPIPTAAILPRELPRLPASTLEELEAAEAAIHDEAVATVLKEQLLRIGGRTLLETTANVMKGLMGHSVQVLFSLYGRKGKRPFNSMQLCRVAIDAICEKQAVDRTTALAVIGKWLPGSVDRGGGRKRRFAAMIAEPSAQLSAEPSAQPPAEPAGSAIIYISSPATAQHATQKGLVVSVVLRAVAAMSLLTLITHPQVVVQVNACPDNGGL